MKKQIVFVMVLLAVVFAVLPVSAQQQWPMVNACRERPSWAAEEDVLHPPLQKVAQYAGSIESYTEISSWYNNLLITSIENDTSSFIAWDEITGTSSWTFFVPESNGSPNFIAAQNDSLVFIGDQGGLGLYALDRSTVQVKWFRAFGGLMGRNPIVDEDRLYIVKDSLYCLEVGSGSTIWSYPFAGTVSPAVDDSNCYLCGKNKVMAFDKMTGLKKWEQVNYKRDYNTLMVDAERLYTVSDDSLVARSKATGAIEWGYQVAGAEFPDLVTGGAAVCDNFVCFVVWENSAGVGQIFTINKADGSYRWDHAFASVGAYAPVIANNVVYVVAWEDAELWGFDLETGAVLFYDNSQHYLGQPIVANHRLFAGTDKKTIVFANEGTAVGKNELHYPQSFLQWQNYPNPFNPATTIAFDLPEQTNVAIVIYDISGRTVKSLLHEACNPGQRRVSWDGRDDSGKPVSSGVYLCKFSTDRGFAETKRMTLVK